eukprot:scaffold260565_cov32-Tisochrysis_lutea.AAC.6
MLRWSAPARLPSPLAPPPRAALHDPWTSRSRSNRVHPQRPSRYACDPGRATRPVALATTSHAGLPDGGIESCTSSSVGKSLWGRVVAILREGGEGSDATPRRRRSPYVLTPRELPVAGSP